MPLLALVRELRRNSIRQVPDGRDERGAYGQHMVCADRTVGSRHHIGFSVAAVCATLLGMEGCSSNKTSGDSCSPGDQDGVLGGNNIVLVNVSDTSFAVGGVDSGSDQRNIAIQNLSSVMLTLTNVGMKPHDFVVQCIPTGLPAGCPTQSCFPSSANISALSPGQSATATFTTPAAEGAYQFISDVPGDTQTDPNGVVGGLVGEFVLQ